MDVKILDSWLKDYLDTKATPQKIAKYLSLCGPSVERIHKINKDFLYDIEVTTNRVDSASVYGIAREAAAILPRFGIKAKLKMLNIKNANAEFVKKVTYLNVKVDPKLCPRFTAVLIRDIKVNESPSWIKQRLEAVGIRSINNVVDISNFIMIAFGQPVHTFDYDRISDAVMTLRESKKGEEITTLDGKDFTLPGGDIVIEDGSHKIIDLCGIMGGNNSSIDENTKNVLLFVQTYDPVRIRKTSMTLAQRTMAATLFEKGTDTELVTPAILSAIHLFEHTTKGKVEKEILDIYPSPYVTKKISTDLSFIEKRLGISISKTDISEYLKSLGFENSWSGDKLTTLIPSFRNGDVTLPEDIVEEIARIYGYHNMPSVVMNGNLTGRVTSPKFKFETDIKNYLSGWGGVEVYTLSLTTKDSDNALKLKNPLGVDTEYLRTTLRNSLISAASQNKGTFESYHLFEMSNVYIPKKNDLPDEKLILAGIFEGAIYREAKGIIEALFEKLNIKVNFSPIEEYGFVAGKSVSILTLGRSVGKIGYTEDEYIYYEIDMQTLWDIYQKTTIQYKPISKYPAQIEDITFEVPEKTYIGQLESGIMNQESRISKVELKDVFQNSHTFRIEYQDPNKTLTDSEVEKIRNKIITNVKEKFGAEVKN